ncbi:MAG: YaeQ family protein [Thermodesulfobacteriota bacterium]
MYEQLNLKVACHPSETEEYLLTRLLAYCLEYTEGIAFSRGLGDPDEPAISVRDLTGALKAWIEVGSPDAARVHKASKASPRVAIYTHREPRLLLRAYGAIPI